VVGLPIVASAAAVAVIARGVPIDGVNPFTRRFGVVRVLRRTSKLNRLCSVFL
jgi:hypothetical protein